MNGVAERMNRTLLEKAKAMLFYADLNDDLWSEAILAATFLTNRSPTSAIKKKTPYQSWFKSKPNLSRLKVFGSRAFVWIPKEKRHKLDKKSFECVLVGYTAEGYRLWDSKSREIVTRNVQFDELTSKADVNGSCQQYQEPFIIQDAINHEDVSNVRQPTPLVVREFTSLG